MTKSQTSLIKSKKLSIDSCNIGDNVLVLWNKGHQKYMILQQSYHLHFLNSDSLETLELNEKANEDERKPYCIGEVYYKEYCHAKKVIVLKGLLG